MDFDDIPAETPLSPEDAIIRRHRREKKELQGKIVGMKKALAKSDKKKKKDLEKEIEKLEADLETRHKVELDAFRPIRQPQLEESQAVEIPKTENEKCSIETSNSVEKDEEEGEGKGSGKMSKAQKRRQKKAIEERERQKRIDSETEHLEESSDWKIEDEKLDEILSNLKLQVYEIPSDGHCLYSAISHQLSQHNEKKSKDELRSLTAQCILKNKGDFIEFFEEKISTSDEEFKKYCAEIESTAVWGGQVEVKALSQFLKRPIRVLQAEGVPLLFGEEFDKESLTLTYHRHKISMGAHYNSVIPKSEVDGKF